MQRQTNYDLDSLFERAYSLEEQIVLLESNVLATQPSVLSLQADETKLISTQLDNLKEEVRRIYLNSQNITAYNLELFNFLELKFVILHKKITEIFENEQKHLSTQESPRKKSPRTETKLNNSPTSSLHDSSGMKDSPRKEKSLFEMPARFSPRLSPKKRPEQKTSVLNILTLLKDAEELYVGINYFIHENKDNGLNQFELDESFSSLKEQLLHLISNLPTNSASFQRSENKFREIKNQVDSTISRLSKMIDNPAIYSYHAISKYKKIIKQSNAMLAKLRKLTDINKEEIERYKNDLSSFISDLEFQVIFHQALDAENLKNNQLDFDDFCKDFQKYVLLQKQITQTESIAQKELVSLTAKKQSKGKGKERETPKNTLETLPKFKSDQVIPKAASNVAKLSLSDPGNYINKQKPSSMTTSTSTTTTTTTTSTSLVSSTASLVHTGSPLHHLNSSIEADLDQIIDFLKSNISNFDLILKSKSLFNESNKIDIRLFWNNNGNLLPENVIKHFAYHLLGSDSVPALPNNLVRPAPHVTKQCLAYGNTDNIKRFLRTHADLRENLKRACQHSRCLKFFEGLKKPKLTNSR